MTDRRRRSISNRLADALMKAMNLTHRAVLAATGGRVGWKLGRMTVLRPIV